MDLAAFLTQPHPPPFALAEIILDLHRGRRSRAPRNRASARSAPDPYGNARKSPPMTLRAFFIRASRRRIRNRRWKMVPPLRPRADNVLRCPQNS